MDIEPVESSGMVRLNAAEQARQVADFRQTAILQNQGVSVTTPSPPVVENPRYSPSLYAQAAQFQLYTQSGALASLVQQGHIAAAETPFHEHGDDISAVDATQGGSVNTLA